MNKLLSAFQPTLTEAGLKNFGLTLKQTPACQLLQNVVHSYLQITATEPTLYPVVPDGSQAIYISPSGILIGGAQSCALDVPLLEAGEYFGIRFRPGALRHFFRLNLFEITDQFVDSQFLPCKKFGQLHHHIYQFHTFSQRAQVCEQWLLQQFKPQTTTPFDHALSLIYRSLGNVKIAHLASEVGWSSRHLNRLFRLHTGLSTKTFAQTIRLQHVCKQLYLSPNNTVNTAIDYGFFDQSHLLNEFKKRLLLNNRLFAQRFMSDFSN